MQRGGAGDRASRPSVQITAGARRRLHVHQLAGPRPGRHHREGCDDRWPRDAGGLSRPARCAIRAINAHQTAESRRQGVPATALRPATDGRAAVRPLRHPGVHDRSPHGRRDGQPGRLRQRMDGCSPCTSTVPWSPHEQGRVTVRVSRSDPEPALHGSFMCRSLGRPRPPRPTPPGTSAPRPLRTRARPRWTPGPAGPRSPEVPGETAPDLALDKREQLHGGAADPDVPPAGDQPLGHDRHARGGRRPASAGVSLLSVKPSRVAASRAGRGWRPARSVTWPQGRGVGQVRAQQIDPGAAPTSASSAPAAPSFAPQQRRHRARRAGLQQRGRSACWSSIGHSLAPPADHRPALRRMQGPRLDNP